METQITISTIIIIVWLIFPGVVFKRFYYKGQFAKQFGAGLFADRLITSIFWGITVQIITFLVFSRYLGITFISARDRITEVYTSLGNKKVPNIVYGDLKYILGYLAFLIIIAYCLGSILHFIIRYFKIDLKQPAFRFENHWNYYFRGEIVAMREFKSLNKGKWLSTVVDVVIDDGGEKKNKLISGFLTQHTISQKTGELEAIYLTSASRWSQTDMKFNPVPGDCFVIPFNKIIDLNLRYTFKVITPDQKKIIIFKNILWFALTIGLVFILIFPWYLNVRVIFKILGIIFGSLSWLFLIMILSNPFDPRPTVKLSKKDLWPLLIILVITTVITLFFLDLTPTWKQLKDIFHIS